jgi:hypothetical protein
LATRGGNDVATHSSLGGTKMRRFLKPLFDRLFTREQEPIPFSEIFERFQNILLQDHHRVMEIMADLGEKSCGDFIFDRKYLQDSVRDFQDILLRMVKELNLIGSSRYMELYSTLDRVLPSSPSFQAG